MRWTPHGGALSSFACRRPASDRLSVQKGNRPPAHSWLTARKNLLEIGPASTASALAISIEFVFAGRTMRRKMSKSRITLRSCHLSTPGRPWPMPFARPALAQAAPPSPWDCRPAPSPDHQRPKKRNGANRVAYRPLFWNLAGHLDRNSDRLRSGNREGPRGNENRTRRASTRSTAGVI